MSIAYRIGRYVQPHQLAALLASSGLSKPHRFADDERLLLPYYYPMTEFSHRIAEALTAMVHASSLLVSAWDGPELVGVARTITDFAYEGAFACGCPLSGDRLVWLHTVSR
jgi:hypothetical protein